MAIKRINPSRNAWDNSNRQNYGYVIRVPKLPDAHKFVVDFIVFNESDNCFYKCVEVTNATQHYYTWRAVTFGASRAFLIPVGKLTSTDIHDVTEIWTEKNFVACIPKTLNEIVFGLRRYKGTIHSPIGYTQITGTYDDSTEYYRWSWNDTCDSIEMVLRKRFTGELKLLEKGVDYIVGDPIEEETYVIPSAIGKSGDEPDWKNITMKDMVAKANELIERLNQHEADIPLASEADTADHFCYIINSMIEEVNPFCIPWQLLLNRQNFLELEVGQVQLTDPSRITPTVRISRTNLAKWAEVQWECFYFLTSDTTYQSSKTYYHRTPVAGGVVPHDYTYTEIVSPSGAVAPNTYEKYTMPTELLYGTVCQAVDAALNLIRYKDMVTGRLRDLKELTLDTGDTLVAWLNRLKLKVDEFSQSIEDAKLSLKQIHDSIGDVGFVRARSENFEDVTPSTEWPGYYYWDVDRSLFVLIETSEYPASKKIADWETAHPGLYVYQFINEDIARTLIAKNAADILLNKQLVDNLLGTQLKRIYVEKLDATGVVGDTYYYYDRSSSEEDHPFIPFEWEDGKTLSDYQKLYHSPIFVPCERNEYIVSNETHTRAGETYYYLSGTTYTAITAAAGTDLSSYRASHGTIYVKKQTAAVQIRVNNEEIHRVGFQLYNYKVEIDADIEELNKRNKRLKQLTGVNGNDDVVAEWVVDGYLELTKEGQYREYRKYYKLDPTSTDPLRLVEMISGTEAELAAGFKFILTVDETFRSGVEYYTRSGTTTATFVYELATVTPGEAVTPKTYYNKATIDYVVPFYALTEDTIFQAGKTYYKVNTEGKFVAEIVTPGNVPEENTWYEFHNPTPRPAGGVYIRKARKEHGGYEENNTHRGLIDRNTRDIEDHRQECGNFQKWTKQQLQAIEDFIFSLMLSTLDVITQERSTLSLLHETVGKLITLHNALERLQGNQTLKPGDGVYDSGYDYFMKGEKEQLPDQVVIQSLPGVSFFVTEDKVFQEGKTYYTKGLKHPSGATYYAEYDTSKLIGTTIPEDPDYYEMDEGSIIITGVIKRWKGFGFFLTKDSTFVLAKTYYTRTGKGTARDPYIYSEYKPKHEHVYNKYVANMPSGDLPAPVYVDVMATEDPSDYIECTTGEQVVETMDEYWSMTPDYDPVTDTYNITEDWLCYTRGPIPGNTYYEWHDLYKMEPGVDYEIGLEVGQNVYTKDLVIATTENYTINEIRLAVNRVLSYHITSKELPTYTELPDTEIILESMKYYRYIDEEWEEIIPEEDDPSMIGKRIKDYDPVNKWYINTGTPVPDGSESSKRYTETPVRMFLNELVKLHRRSKNTTNPMDLAASLILGLGSLPTSSTYGSIATILPRS